MGDQMTISRRDLLAAGAGLAGTTLTFPAWAGSNTPGRSNSAKALFIDPATLEPFVDALPIPPVAQPVTPAQPNGESAHYRIEMRAAPVKVHRDLPATRMWTYDGHHPGPTFETRSGQPLSVEWINNLPTQHFLPVDYTLCGMSPGAQAVRSVVHVHGGRTPADSDGFPEDWYPPGESRIGHYPNGQDATGLWYHDHAMGVSRLNHYAGLMGMFFIRDDVEDALELPRGDYEIPLLLADRNFNAEGQLYYPDSGIPNHPWIAEVSGNAVMLNGKLFPFTEVEPRRYRLRLVNGSNQRFLRLALAGQRHFFQIGSDQGLFGAPVELETLLLAPAERADLIIDFSQWRGQTFTLTNDGRAILQFRVGRTPAADNPPLPSRLRPVQPIAQSQAVRTRDLTLDEYMKPSGDSMLMLLGGKRWYSQVTEDPVLGTVEIWHLINLTEDTHPIHLHLVRFQILDRRPMDIFSYQNFDKLRYLGDARPPLPQERGWKDTVQAHPGTVTRIIVPFDGYPGRYVWHCHIWEHAANEMMRPYILKPSPADRSDAT